MAMSALTLLPQGLRHHTAAHPYFRAGPAAGRGASRLYTVSGTCSQQWKICWTSGISTFEYLPGVQNLGTPSAFPTRKDDILSRVLGGSLTALVPLLRFRQTHRCIFDGGNLSLLVVLGVERNVGHVEHGRERLPHLQKVQSAIQRCGQLAAAKCKTKQQERHQDGKREQHEVSGNITKAKWTGQSANYIPQESQPAVLFEHTPRRYVTYACMRTPLFGPDAWCPIQPTLPHRTPDCCSCRIGGTAY